MVENITMNVNDTLELDYLVEQISDDTIDITSKPTTNSYSMNYVNRRTGIFDPTETGTFQLDINGQVIEIEVTDIPDSVVSQYRFEDDSDTTTADDAIGSNKLNLSGVSYSSTARCGSLSASFDGADDRYDSDNTTDIYSNGATNGAAVATFLNVNTVTDPAVLAGWGPDDNNFLLITIDDNGNGQNIAGRFRVSGTEITVDSGQSPSTSSFDHAVLNVDANDVWLILDGTEVDRTSHSLDPTNIGAAPFFGGEFYGGAGGYDGLLDNTSYSNEPLTESEAQQLIDQC